MISPSNKLMLTIDLSKRTHEIVEIPHKIIKQYLGGRGLGAYLLYNLVPAKVDPLSEDNHIIFTAGPLSGTSFFYSSKTNLTTKSPLTNAYLYSISSGILAHKMKQTGYWAIDIKGIADSPIYIGINNQKVEFRDASALWGVETAEVQRAMLGGLSSKKAATVAIGPAGEKLITYAPAFSEGPLYRCFGRGGAGCVMGSKKLKGILVTGDGEVQVPDKDRSEAVKRDIVKKLKTDWKKWADEWRRYETAADLQLTSEAGMIPTRNWQTGQFEGWRGIDKSTTPMGWPEKNRACAPYCLTPGCHCIEVKEGPYKGAHSDIEWETIYAFGSQCGVDKLVMIYERLRNMAALVLTTAYFTAVHLGLRSKLEILAGHALRAAKRIFGIPNFRYYALADAIKDILSRSRRGLDLKLTKAQPQTQLPLLL